MLNESVKQVDVLTEETIQKFDEHNKKHGMSYAIDVLIKSHRTLNSRNAKLVHENDELMAENVKLKSALKRERDDAVIWDNVTVFSRIDKLLEGLNHE